jgi:hypothetical protein
MPLYLIPALIPGCLAMVVNSSLSLRDFLGPGWTGWLEWLIKALDSPIEPLLLIIGTKSCVARILAHAVKLWSFGNGCLMVQHSLQLVKFNTLGFLNQFAATKIFVARPPKLIPRM